MNADLLASLRARARAAADRAHVPFSGEGAAAVLLLSDGTWVPGVRVESASFSLTIAPALNAFTTAVAAGRRDVVAAAFSRPVRPVERAFLDDVTGGALALVGTDACAAWGASLPALGARLDPFLPAALPSAPRGGVLLARSVAERALVPSSHFPVGCVLHAGGMLVPGANVEPVATPGATEWSHVLCAERSALGTACTYGLLGDASAQSGVATRGGAATRGGEGGARKPSEGKADASEAEASEAEASEADDAPVLYLSCLKDAAGSPCGACRQLLVELVPRGALWMDRAPGAPEPGAPERAFLPDLLPGSFRGAALPPRSAPGA